MEVIKRSGDSATVELSQDELRALTGALNEICNGPSAISEWEFQTRVAVTRGEAEQLLHALSDLC
jgi:hypothetical protein